MDTKTLTPYFKQVALKHYTEVLEQARAAQTATDFNRAVKAQQMEKALQAAQFEARHTGPFNHSGTESNAQLARELEAELNQPFQILEEQSA
jgi:hypothetical protein